MVISGTTSGPELLVELDRAAPEPLHRQLANGLRDAIRTGRLAPATRLPSTRVLAAKLTSHWASNRASLQQGLGWIGVDFDRSPIIGQSSSFHRSR